MGYKLANKPGRKCPLRWIVDQIWLKEKFFQRLTRDAGASYNIIKPNC